jgi:hypothetical protein
MEHTERMDSWKNIANYLKRDVATCRKWMKKYQLPVYRIDAKSKRSSVFAFKNEIDIWFIEKAKKQSRMFKKSGSL